ncbi:hypothetical protein JAGODDHD_02268 [Sphingomonas paucimobilis]|nr:hypothetical protein [Sphingomonas paucimobilis]
MIPSIAAPVDAHLLMRPVTGARPLRRDRPLVCALQHRLRLVGVEARLIADDLEAGDMLLQRCTLFGASCVWSGALQSRFDRHDIMRCKQNDGLALVDTMIFSRAANRGARYRQPRPGGRSGYGAAHRHSQGRLSRTARPATGRFRRGEGAPTGGKGRAGPSRQRRPGDVRRADGHRRDRRVVGMAHPYRVIRSGPAIWRSACGSPNTRLCPAPHLKSDTLPVRGKDAQRI